MQWFYADQGKSVGPISEDEFRGLVASGKITTDTLVWNESMPQWVKHGTLNQQTPSSPFVAETPPQQSDIGAGGVGNTHNRDLMAQARETLRGNWGIAIGACVVMAAISILASLIPVFGVLVSFLVSGPLTLGLAVFFIALSRGQNAEIGMVFSSFNRFGTALAAYFFVNLFVLLWTILLIIPGIIAALSYSMTYYILADNQSMGALDAISASKKMMQGSKWKFFCLGWRFFGWSLLCVLTLGIGFFWLIPYMDCSLVKFYEDVRGKTAGT